MKKLFLFIAAALVSTTMWAAGTTAKKIAAGDQYYSAYAEAKTNLSTNDWVSTSGSPTNSGTSYTAPSGWLDGGSGKPGYGLMNVQSGKTVTFTVTNITGVSILGAANSSGRSINLSVKENGSEVGEVATKTGTSIGVVTYGTELNKNKTYSVTVSASSANDAKFYQIKFVGAGPRISAFSPATGTTVKSGTTVTITGSTGSTVYYMWASEAPANAAAVVTGGTAGTAGAATVISSGIDSENGTTLYAVAVEDATNSAVASASYTIDDAAPTFSSSVPSNSATDVAVEGSIVLTFNEAIESVDGTKFSLNGATKGDVAIDGTDSKKVNVSYSGASYNTTVTLSVAAEAVADAAGNKSAALSDIKFTTEAEPATAAPAFTTPASEPAAAEYVIGATIPALEVAVTGYPEPTLQWYSNTSKSTTGATELTGEDGDSYTPSNTAASDLYYYCVATNSSGSAQSYYFHVIVTEEDNTLLVKVDLSGDNGSTQTLSGTAKTNAEASVQKLAKSSPYKLNNDYQSYVALTLTSGYFQKGDSVVLNLDKTGLIYCGELPASDAGAAPDGATNLGTTTNKSGIHYFILPESLPKNTTRIYIYRTTSTYNCKLTYMAVYRIPSPGPSTALDNTADEAKAVKFIKDGQIFIEKNGHVYNVLGGCVK